MITQRFTARALLDPSIPSGAYGLLGPESLSGEQSADNWSVALGRLVRYAPDIPLFDRLLEREFGGRKALDFQKTYRLLARAATKMKPRDLQQTTLLPGRQARSHAEYVREMAAEWAGAGEVIR